MVFEVNGYRSLLTLSGKIAIDMPAESAGGRAIVIVQWLQLAARYTESGKMCSIGSRAINQYFPNGTNTP